MAWNLGVELEPRVRFLVEKAIWGNSGKAQMFTQTTWLAQLGEAEGLDEFQQVYFQEPKEDLESRARVICLSPLRFGVQQALRCGGRAKGR